MSAAIQNEDGTVLVPIDFSDQSRAAAERGFAWADARGASVTLLHAFHLPAISTEIGFSGSGWDELRTAELDRLRRFRNRFEGRGPSIATVFSEDEPSRAIHSAARDANVGLTVMGSHGRRGLDRFLMGSVAERSVQAASCPVLVVREPIIEARKPVESILFVTDFSEKAHQAEQAIAVWAGLLHAEIEILHVAFETTALYAPYGVPSSKDFDEDVQEAASRRMAASVGRLQAMGVAAKQAIVSGIASEEILKRAETTGVQCIAMGSRGHSGLRRHRLGSVVQQVLRNAPCSVFVSA